MTIKEIKEKYKDYLRQGREKNSFVVYKWKNDEDKYVIIVNRHPCKYIGSYVTGLVRVRDGKELLSGSSRPCDNLDDAIDVAGEMKWAE